VSQEDFSAAAVVLLGHGTSLNAQSAAPVWRHAAALRQAGTFAEVREAFWKQSPRVQEVLPSLVSSRVFLVPLFISEGYFSEQVIPRELGFRFEGTGPFNRVLQQAGKELFYAKPVGTHPGMTEVVLKRAREVVDQFPFPRPPRPREIALFIAGHGTGRDENSRAAVVSQVTLLRARNLYQSVDAVFLEERPGIAECYQLASARNMVVVPFFMSDGLHAQEDIPRLLGESDRTIRERVQRGQSPWRNPTEKHGKRVWYASSVGMDPLVEHVILERVREALSWR
jgi:sirohydrochlorin cobaltochelatase